MMCAASFSARFAMNRAACSRPSSHPTITKRTPIISTSTWQCGRRAGRFATRIRFKGNCRLGGRPDGIGHLRKAVAGSKTLQPARDAAGKARSFEHHRRIDLNEARPGADAFPRLFGSRNAADADQRQPAAARGPKILEPLEREVAKR